ncbi:MAG: ATP-binding protein [Candidatus Binataceae bacterium]
MLEQNERTLEQQLTSLRFLSVEGIPNAAAMLIFGKDPGQWVPGAYVQFLRIAGTELTDPIVNQKAVTGPLPTQLRQLDEILAANISTYTSITRSVIEIAEPDYPMLLLQQLTRNAIMHRVYDNTSSPVRLYWFTDRVEIHSPGGLYGQVTRENFGKGATDYRNPLVAEAMKVLGYVQRFGMGLPLTKSELEKNGNPEAQFGFQANFVLATLFKRP